MNSYEHLRSVTNTFVPHYLLQHLWIHLNQMRFLGEAAFFHVGDILGESGDAFALQPLILLHEVAISLRVARRAFLVIAQDIVREEELRIATAPRSERHE